MYELLYLLFEHTICILSMIQHEVYILSMTFRHKVSITTFSMMFQHFA